MSLFEPSNDNINFLNSLNHVANHNVFGKSQGVLMITFHLEKVGLFVLSALAVDANIVVVFWKMDM